MYCAVASRDPLYDFTSSFETHLSVFLQQCFLPILEYTAELYTPPSTIFEFTYPKLKDYKYIIRDIIDFYYDPMNPNKDPEFSIQVGNAMNVMAMNLALCFRNLDKVELGIMSSFAISNTFIVHLVCIL